MEEGEVKVEVEIDMSEMLDGCNDDDLKRVLDHLMSTMDDEDIDEVLNKYQYKKES